MKLNNILIFIALFLIVINTFGFLGFSTMEHNEKSLCPISFMSSSDCPSENALNLAGHHILALRFLTQSIISLNLILLLILFILFFIFVFYLTNILGFLPNNFSQNKKLKYIPFKEFFAFLARYNKQDPYYILLSVV